MLQIPRRDEFLRSAAPDRAATFDDGVTVGERMRRSTYLSITRIDCPMGLQQRETAPDLVADQRRETFGGFVRISSRGLVISARPIASICCSPPES